MKSFGHLQLLLQRPVLENHTFDDGAQVFLLTSDRKEVRMQDVLFDQQAILPIEEEHSRIEISIAADGKDFRCGIDIKEVPTDTHINAELDCYDEPGNLAFKIKITVNYFMHALLVCACYHVE